MTATIATTVRGGSVGVGTASVVHIENQYIGISALSTQASQETGEGDIPPCPYPGLSYFGPRDSALFFGREAAIAQLEAAVVRQTLTALVGASGSGKSSVVLAGLAPRLHGLGGWRFSQFRVGIEANKNPFLALSRAVVPLLGVGSTADQLEDIQRLAGRFENGTVDLPNVMGACRAANPGKRILLIADQFEETFTLISDEQLRDRFIDFLLTGFPIRTDVAMPEICLVLTLRADFYGMAMLHRPLADALQDRLVNLGPMTRTELRMAITRPAAHVTFEEGLIDVILDDVESQPGSLPLLQFALREMWGRLDKPRVTRAGYDGIGGIKGALKLRAQSIYDAETRNGEDTQAAGLFRRLFTRLVTLGEGADDTRRIVRREELGPEAWQLAQRLAGEDNRLVVTAAPAVGHETVEVVHEALIRNWPSLVEWVQRDRAFLSWLHQFKQRVAEWHGHPEDTGTLLRGGLLAVAEEWRGRRGEELNREQHAYIDASLALREGEERREKEALAHEQSRLAEIATEQEKTARLQRRARSTLGAMAAIVAAGCCMGGWLLWTNLTLRASVDQRQVDLIDELAAVAQANGNLDSALRLAVYGARLEPKLARHETILSPARSELATARLLASWYMLLHGHTAAVNSASFSPDDTRIVTASSDRTARVWDVNTGSQLLVLSDHTDAVNSAVYSPDGKRIITASNDQTARIWDAKSGRELVVLRGHAIDVRYAAFSFDGTLVVTASSDKTARIWDSMTGRELGELLGHKAFVDCAAFNSEGTRIVTGSGDKTAAVWDVATLRRVSVLTGHKSAVTSVAFSHDGSHILTGSSDNTAGIWDAKTAVEIETFTGSKSDVLSAAFSPDEQRILTASADDTARIWDVDRDIEILPLRGHEDSVRTAAFSRNGSRVVTASADKTVRVWRPFPSQELFALHSHTGAVNSAVYSNDGSRIVTASDDNKAMIWDSVSGKRIVELVGHGDVVRSAEFSPDGSRVVTSSNDGEALIWDLSRGESVVAPSVALKGHDDAVRWAAFSPDGTRVVTASADRTARVWDAISGKTILVLRGHEDVVRSAAFSPDGSRIVTASNDKTARIWDSVTGTQISVLKGHQGIVTSAKFSPNGRLIVTSSFDNTARIWSAVEASEIGVLQGHEDIVRSADFSPDGSRIITGSADGTARVWDVSTTAEISLLRTPEKSVVTFAAFSPSGLQVVTASWDNMAHVWDARFAVMPEAGLVSEVCSQRLASISHLTADEMRLVGYPDNAAPIDACGQGVTLFH